MMKLPRFSKEHEISKFKKTSRDDIESPEPKDKRLETMYKAALCNQKSEDLPGLNEL